MWSTDPSLLGRLGNLRDGAVWGRFVAQYEPLLSRYLASRGVSEADRADVVQEVMARLVRALPEFRHDPAKGRFRTWLWRVAMNAVADYYRREGLAENARAAGAARAEQLARESSDDPEEAWNAAYRGHLLHSVLAEVKAQSRAQAWTCFEQHLLHGRPAAEVGGELGMSTGLVYVNASRVLAVVRTRCEQRWESLADV